VRHRFVQAGWLRKHSTQKSTGCIKLLSNKAIKLSNKAITKKKRKIKETAKQKELSNEAIKQIKK
jgi:hypothetical protein